MPRGDAALASGSAADAGVRAGGPSKRSAAIVTTLIMGIYPKRGTLHLTYPPPIASFRALENVMANSVLSAPHFQNEDAAFEYVESHLWPRGPVCPHCGERERIGRLNGKPPPPGLRKCYACRKPFTVRIGSIFEDSHLPLHLWLQV